MASRLFIIYPEFTWKQHGWPVGLARCLASAVRLTQIQCMTSRGPVRWGKQQTENTTVAPDPKLEDRQS